MLSTGNGNITNCITNLLMTYKGEVPYARGKGVNSSTLNLPHTYIEQQLIADADEVIDAYEPRASTVSLKIDTSGQDGDYKYTVNVKEK